MWTSRRDDDGMLNSHMRFCSLGLIDVTLVKVKMDFTRMKIVQISGKGMGKETKHQQELRTRNIPQARVKVENFR